MTLQYVYINTLKGTNMRIFPIRNNYCNCVSNKRKTTANFKAILPPSEINRLLRMFKPTVTETIVSKDFDILKRISNMLFRKYLPKGIDSYGVVVIPDKNLKEFCMNIKAPFDKIDSMKGFCVAAGGKYSPMQIWTEVYETKLVLIPKDKIYA